MLSFFCFFWWPRVSHGFFGFHVRELTYRPYAIGFIRKSCVRPSVQASGSCQLPCKMEGVDLYQAGCYMIINLPWRIHFLSIQNAVPNQCKIRRFAYFLVARWDPMRMALALWITTPKGTPEFCSYCTPFWNLFGTSMIVASKRTKKFAVTSSGYFPSLERHNILPRLSFFGYTVYTWPSTTLKS